MESIANLMRSMKLTCEQAMAALGIPEADWEWYAKKLNKNQCSMQIEITLWSKQGVIFLCGMCHYLESEVLEK